MKLYSIIWDDKNTMYKVGGIIMKQLYIKQKVFSLNEKFSVKDQDGNDVYNVSGSFFKIPKTFTIYNTNNEEVATITKKIFALLPTFYVDVNGHGIVTIKKKLSFLKARYTVEADGIEVKGNLLDMNFTILQNGNVIGKVNKKWFSWGDSYEVQIFNEQYETITVALVVAIDYVKELQSTVASTTPIE